MSQLQQIALELPEELYTEIEHLSQSEKDSFFHQVLKDQIEKQKSTDMQEQLKNGYAEMAALNAEICAEFEYAETESTQTTERRLNEQN